MVRIEGGGKIVISLSWRRGRCPALLCGLLVVALAVAPGSASASQVSVSGDTLSVIAAPRERNSVHINRASPWDETTGDVFLVTDGWGLTPVPPCVPFGSGLGTQAFCPSPGITKLFVRTLDWRDSISIEALENGPGLIPGRRMTTLLQGGGGPDRLYGSISRDRLIAGNGRDWLNGGGNRDVLKGGAGNDLLRGARAADILFGNRGNDFLDGGPGFDRCFGGPGHDRQQACRLRRSIP
jgi:hypothetical protein